MVHEGHGDNQEPATPAGHRRSDSGASGAEDDGEVSGEPSGPDDEGDHPGFREVRGQLRPTQPNRTLNPFDIHFSQMRCAAAFRDNRLLEDSLKEIQVVKREVVADDAATSSEASVREPSYRLECPFPAIEVLPWRCKLRDEAGKPLVDPASGGELYDDRDRFFTLDNRRLTVMQKAAVSVYPAPVFVDVIEIPSGPLARMRELRKFRTLDRGRSINIGGRAEGEVLDLWSWRKAAGIEEVKEDVCPIEAGNCEVQMRRRPRNDRRGLGARQGGARRDSDSRARGDDDSVGNQGLLMKAVHFFRATPSGGFIGFLAIYLLLRVSLKFVPSTTAAVKDAMGAHPMVSDLALRCSIVALFVALAYIVLRVAGWKIERR